MINLTVKEKDDLKEVYDCLLIQNKIESALYNIYASICVFVKKVGNFINK